MEFERWSVAGPDELRFRVALDELRVAACKQAMMRDNLSKLRRSSMAAEIKEFSGIIAQGVCGVVEMSLSDQFRPMRRCVFSGFAMCCAAALIGCGGTEEPATSDATPSAESTNGSSGSAMPGASAMPGGAEANGAGGAGVAMESAPGMGGAPGMGSAPGGGVMMSGAPGMSGAMPGGSGGHGAEGASPAMSGAPGMAGMPAGYDGGEQNGGYGGGQAPAVTLRPESFDAWTDADFLSAARERDPRVLDAIDFKVKSAPGDASVAVLLTSLLDLPPLPAQANANGAASGYPGMSGAPGSGSSFPGSSSFGAGSSGSAPPTETTMPMGPSSSAPGSGAQRPKLSSPAAASPQSSLGKPMNEHFRDSETGSRVAIDSVSAMILEAAVTYMPQGAAVGAVAGGVPGRIEGLTGQASGSATTPKGMPSAAMPGGAMPGGAMPGGAMPGGMNPTGGYPGGEYPGGDGQLGNGPPNAGQLQDRLLVSKVVDGLIANNSQEAWQSVFGIVEATVKTPLPNAANCEIVVERLVHNMDSNPEVIQPVILAFLDSDSATQLPPESRSACLRMLAAISATQTDALTGFAMTETPPAAAPGGASGFPGSGGEGESGSSGAAPGFPGMSGAGGFPGMNGPGGDAAAPRNSLLPQVSLELDVVEKGANFLWSPKSIAAIVGQLEKATDLTTASDVLLLASTIPGADVRNAICETFIRLHPSGSDGLNASGFFSEVHDPAMVVILKALPRTRPSKEAPGTMDSWTSGTESLVLALRDELKRTSGSMKPYTGTLPVKLHKNATAEVSVMLQIPGGTPDQSPDSIPAPTTVYYTRTSFAPVRKNDTKDLTAHYEGRTSGYSRQDETRGVMWIEGVKALPNGHRRTLDVIIEKAGGGGANQQMGFGGGGSPGGMMETGPGPGGGGGVQSGNYTVEIIVVDTIDPKNASPAGITQAAATP